MVKNSRIKLKAKHCKDVNSNDDWKDWEKRRDKISRLEREEGQYRTGMMFQLMVVISTTIIAGMTEFYTLFYLTAIFVIFALFHAGLLITTIKEIKDLVNYKDED